MSYEAEASELIRNRPGFAREVARQVRQSENESGGAVGLTPAMRQLFDFIVAFIDDWGHPPTYDEMRDNLGYHSKSSVHRQVLCLEERGYVRRLPQRNRSITVIRQP